jgi:hypothetical protein
MSHSPTIVDDVLMISKRETDSIVVSVLQKFLDRSAFGKQKYGTDLDRTDLSVLDWIQHAQEEHMDARLYLEKLKVEWKKTQNREHTEPSNCSITP